MIDLAILGLLKEQDLHGYELKKRLTELLGSRGAMSFGSLYPALARLERAGHVKAVEANTAVGLGFPSSGSLAGELAAFRARHRLTKQGGRSRKVYGITDAGSAHLVSLLSDPAVTDDRGFAIRVAFCRFLPATERLTLFQRRRAELTERLAERARAAATRRPTVDRYLRALRDHDTERTTHDIAWLDWLIAEEQAAPTEDHS